MGCRAGHQLRAASLVLLAVSTLGGVCVGVRRLATGGRLKLIVVGDSLVDTGNTNYVTDVRSQIRANWAPYGQDFSPRGPTGRFSNGKVLTDFFADAGGIPSPPPYLQPGASWASGVNFAVAGAGARSTTKDFSVYSTSVQMQWFATALPSLKIDRSTVCLLSVGSNDYLSFFLHRPRGWKRIISVTVDDVVNKTLTLVQGLYGAGIRNFVLLKIGPLGCTPAARAEVWWNPGYFTDGQQAALWHNSRLDLALAPLRLRFSDANILVLDTFKALSDTSTTLGVPMTTRACCGWRKPTFGTTQCGVGRVDICSNVNQTLFWDFVHPAEHTVRRIFGYAWAGDTSYIQPINLSTLYARLGVLPSNPRL